MRQNVLKRRRQFDRRVAILIAGGFHTTPITTALEELGEPYAVVTPRAVGRPDDKGDLYPVLEAQIRAAAPAQP